MYVQLLYTICRDSLYAGYVNMVPPQHALVVEDCDEALRLDAKYVKALNRRALALEGLERFEESLRGTSSYNSCGFENDVVQILLLRRSLTSSRTRPRPRPLSAFCRNWRAKRRQRSLWVGNRVSPHILSSPPTSQLSEPVSKHFGALQSTRSFFVGAHPALPENPTTGDETLHLALQALEAADYAHAITLVNESIDQGISWDVGKAEALNMRGTFKCVAYLRPVLDLQVTNRFLTGDVDGAKVDFQESINLIPSFTQSLVKIASVHMEQGDPAKAFECFETAIQHNPNDPDIYYHRGQGVCSGHLCMTIFLSPFSSLHHE